MGHTRVDIYSSGGITLEGIAARPEGLRLAARFALRADARIPAVAPGSTSLDRVLGG